LEKSSGEKPKVKSITSIIAKHVVTHHVLILTIIVLAIDGYFVYVFYQNPQNFPILGDGVRDVASAAADDAAVEEVSSRASITAVVHHATSANIVDNSTYIDHPLINNNLDAVLTVTPNWNPGGGTGIYNVHPVGVWYDDAEEKWAILNQDLAPMPKRAAFDVAVSDGTTPAK
jgi:hypothetical protein